MLASDEFRMNPKGRISSHCYKVIRLMSQFTTADFFKECHNSRHPYSSIQRSRRFIHPFNYGVRIWYLINKILFRIDEFRTSDVLIWYIWSCDEIRRALSIIMGVNVLLSPLIMGSRFVTPSDWVNHLPSLYFTLYPYI